MNFFDVIILISINTIQLHSSFVRWFLRTNIVQTRFWRCFVATVVLNSDSVGGHALGFMPSGSTVDYRTDQIGAQLKYTLLERSMRSNQNARSMLQNDREEGREIQIVPDHASFGIADVRSDDWQHGRWLREPADPGCPWYVPITIKHGTLHHKCGRVARQKSDYAWAFVKKLPSRLHGLLRDTSIRCVSSQLSVVVGKGCAPAHRAAAVGLNRWRSTECSRRFCPPHSARESELDECFLLRPR